MSSIWDLANRQLRDLAVYEPGKPIEETARELGTDPDQIIKLASNENPIGPSPKAVEAMGREIGRSQLYPDGGGFYLRNALAEKLGLTPDHIILGNGSNEIIEFCCHAFLNAGDDAIASRYAFIAYKIAATLFSARLLEIACDAPAFAQDLDGMVDAITPKTRLIFLANPNNPTGSLVPQSRIDRFIARVPQNVIVVFDEAYFEFLKDPPDTLRFVRESKNIVVLRTFSKIHGLAALRVGYGIAHPELIRVLQKTREPFNVNSLGQAGALAALEDEEHQRDDQAGRGRRTRLFRATIFRNENTVCPRAANFLMAKVGDGPAVFKNLLERKVIVRPLKGYNLSEWIRISVGTMEQNRKCIAALKEVLATRR